MEEHWKCRARFRARPCPCNGRGGVRSARRSGLWCVFIWGTSKMRWPRQRPGHSFRASWLFPAFPARHDTPSARHHPRAPSTNQPAVPRGISHTPLEATRTATGTAPAPVPRPAQPSGGRSGDLRRGSSQCADNTPSALGAQMAAAHGRAPKYKIL